MVARDTGHPHVVGVQWWGVGEPLVRDDVVIGGVVAVGRVVPLVAEAFPAANPKVKLGRASLLLLGWFQVACVTPVLGFLRGERGEHLRWRRWVGPLDHKRVMDHRTNGHHLLPSVGCMSSTLPNRSGHRGLRLRRRNSPQSSSSRHTVMLAVHAATSACTHPSSLRSGWTSDRASSRSPACAATYDAVWTRSGHSPIQDLSRPVPKWVTP